MYKVVNKHTLEKWSKKVLLDHTVWFRFEEQDMTLEFCQINYLL